MTTYGITNDGFVRKRLPEIRAEVVSALQNNLQAAGITTTIKTSPDSLLGILIDTFAEREATIWELAEGVHVSMYPATASGARLDLAVGFTGVTRLAAASSKGYVVLYGDTGTSVPAGTKLANADTGTEWETTADVTIATTRVADATLKLAGEAAAGIYTVTLNGAAYSYTAASGETAQKILQGLADAISVAGVTVERTGERLRLYTDGSRSFSATAGTLLSVDTLGTPILAQSVSASTEGAEAGALSAMVDSITGWTAVDNLAAATAGRTTETDSELRARYSTGMYALGSGTPAAIVAQLLANVVGVSQARVFENADDAADALGRPPHSLHVVVDGGLDEEVAAIIAAAKPAGIPTFGSVTVQVTDSASGMTTQIKFDRPTPIYVWIQAVVTVLEDGDDFPDDGLTQIQDALLAKGESLGIGSDVRWQAFIGPCYGINGVGEVALAFATSASPDVAPSSDSYSAANITIADYQQATFAAARIEVTGDGA